MPTVKVTVTGAVKLSAPVLSPAELTGLGGDLIHSLRERTAKAINARDQAAKPYSSRGPIYVPIAGRGTITRPITSENIGRGIVGNALKIDSVNKTITFKRTKSTLKGREVLTAKDLQKLKAAGVVIVKKGSKAKPKSGKIIVRDTGRSIKFANYAEYKKALGKSGLRDLELSGRMLNSILIVQQDAKSVTIGFAREDEHRKGQGNQARDQWWGASPADQAFVYAQARKLLPAIVLRMQKG